MKANKRGSSMTAHVCGIDIGKTVFHLIGLSKEGHIVVMKRFSRKPLITHTVNIPACLVGMEACPALSRPGSRSTRAHGEAYARRVCSALRKSNKYDYVDAEAIAEAVQRPTMRFVPIKNEAQLGLQALHRVRDRWIGRRTAVINQIRGFLLEHGIAVATGPAHLNRQIPSMLEYAENLLSPRMSHNRTQRGVEEAGRTDRGNGSGTRPIDKKRMMVVAGCLRYLA